MVLRIGTRVVAIEPRQIRAAQVSAFVVRRTSPECRVCRKRLI
jgi:hypothetical protein